MSHKLVSYCVAFDVASYDSCRTVVARSGSTRWMGMIGRLLLAYHYCKEERGHGAPSTAQVVVAAAARCLLLLLVAKWVAVVFLSVILSPSKME